MENPVSLDRKQISCSGEFNWKELNEMTIYIGAYRTERIKDDGEAPNDWQEGKAITPPGLKEQREGTELLEPKQRRGGWHFPGGSVVKSPPANVGDTGDVGSIPGSGRSPGGGNGNLLQYSCLENSMDRGAWQATVHGVTKSRTWLRDLHYK